MGRPLSVVYFSNSLARGGAEEHILTLVRGLDRSRFRAHLVCTPEVERALRADLPPDVEATALRLRRPGHVGAALALARLLRRRRPDILHSHLFYASLFASPIGRLCRVPVVVETPHLREHWRHGWLKGRFTVDRLVGRFVHRYIAVSEANARYLVEDKGLPARKVTVIRNGCDLERFDPARPPSADLRASLGFEPGDPILLVLGRLEPQKGHRVLLEALPAVLRRFPRTRLVCAGEGALRSALQAQAHAVGLDRAVRFVGQQADVADWLALADITVLPSFYEGLPLAAVESLAAGRPMVATAVDGTPEVVVDGETGLLVAPGDGEGLARALCRLLADPAERQRLARTGRAWVSEHFDERQQVRRTQDLYAAACAGVATTAPAIAGAGHGHERP
jgi:glycosyltransferase involved in cell wall biosynthesis